MLFFWASVFEKSTERWKTRVNGALEGHWRWDEGKEVGSSQSWRKGRSEKQVSEQIHVRLWCSLQLKWIFQPIPEWEPLWNTILALQFHPADWFRSWVLHSMFPARMLGSISFLIPGVENKRWRGEAWVQKVGLGCLHQCPTDFILLKSLFIHFPENVGPMDREMATSPNQPT